MPYNSRLHNHYQGNATHYHEGTGITHGVSDLDFYDVFRPEDFLGVSDPDNISYVDATGIIFPSLRNNLFNDPIYGVLSQKLSWSAYRCLWYNFDEWNSSLKTYIAASSIYGLEEIKLTYQDVGPLDVLHKPYKALLGYPFKYVLGYFADGLPNAQTDIPNYVANGVPNFPNGFDDTTADNILGGSFTPASSIPGGPRLPISNIGTWYSGIADIYENLFLNPKTPQIHCSFPLDLHYDSFTSTQIIGYYPVYTLLAGTGLTLSTWNRWQRNFLQNNGATIPNFDRQTLLNLLDLNLKPNGWYCHDRNSLTYSTDFEPMLSGAIPVIDMVLQNNCNREIARSMFVKGSTQTGLSGVCYLDCDYIDADSPSPPLGDISLMPNGSGMQGNYIHITPPETQFIHGEIYFGTTKPKTFTVDINVSGEPVYVRAINRDWNNNERTILYQWEPLVYVKFTPVHSGFADIDPPAYFNVPFSSSVTFSESQVYAYIITDNESPHLNTLKNYRIDFQTGWKLSPYENKGLWNITLNDDENTLLANFPFSPHRQKIIVPTTSLPINATISVDGINIPLQDISNSKYSGTQIDKTNDRSHTLLENIGSPTVAHLEYMNISGERWEVGPVIATVNFTSEVFYSGGGSYYQSNNLQFQIKNGLNEEWIDFTTDVLTGSGPTFTGSGTFNYNRGGIPDFSSNLLLNQTFSDYNNYQEMTGTITKIPVGFNMPENPGFNVVLNSCQMTFRVRKVQLEGGNTTAYQTVVVSGIINNSNLSGTDSTTVSFTMPTVLDSWWTPA